MPEGDQGLAAEERGALFVEGLVVAVDIAQVAGGAHDVLPGAAFAFKETGDVFVGCAASARGSRRCVRSRRARRWGGAGDEQDGEAVEVDAHAAGERAWLGIGVGFIEHAVIGHGAFLNGGFGDGLKNLLKNRS